MKRTGAKKERDEIVTTKPYICRRGDLGSLIGEASTRAKPVIIPRTQGKKGNTEEYLDSFGNLNPPKELMYYLGAETKIPYNNYQYQNLK